MFASEHFTPKAGMAVWVLPGGNARRSWAGDPIPAKVTAVKRKYFYVQPQDATWKNWKFALEDNTFCDDADTNNNYAVYASQEAALRAVRFERELAEIRRFFSSGGNAAEELGCEKIHAIYELLASTEKGED